MTKTTVTVTRRDTGETAVSINGELVSETAEGDLIRVTVRNGDDEQYVEYNEWEFTHRLDTDGEA